VERGSKSSVLTLGLGKRKTIICTENVVALIAKREKESENGRVIDHKENDEKGRKKKVPLDRNSPQEKRGKEEKADLFRWKEEGKIIT